MKLKWGWLVLAIMTWLALIHLAKRTAYDKGFERGASLMLDTINDIVQKQVDKDTTAVTKVHTETPRDTLTYFLSSKKLRQ